MLFSLEEAAKKASENIRRSSLLAKEGGWLKCAKKEHALKIK